MTATSAAASLTFTGERFVPEVRGAIWYEHWHRYAAVSPLVAGKRVLDAACGEGYGSFLLAQNAQHVTGIDVSAEAIGHARERYSRPNLEFAEGSVTQLPLPAHAVDCVVSFETIEHLAEQREMLAEFRRVLTPEGVLVISSPNRPVYSADGAMENHFHVAELDRDELAALLRPGFPQQAWYAQRVIAQSLLWSLAAAPGAPDFLRLADGVAASSPGPADAMYFVVICAAQSVALPALAPVSLFDDGTLALWRDYGRALERERALAWEELSARNVSEDRLAELVVTINALASEREAGRIKSARIESLEGELVATQARAQQALDRSEAAFVDAQAALARAAEAHAAESDARARSEAALAQERAAHAETQSRLRYRESARGWLRYPLAALKGRRMERGS